MKYTFKEMIEKYPVVFECSYLATRCEIKENFDFLIKGRYYPICKSLEEAKNSIRNSWVKHKDESLKAYTEYFQEYSKYSFIKKIIERGGYNNVSKSYTNALKNFEKEPIPKVNRLNEDLVYNFVGEDIKEGDSLYVVVTQKNLLPVGLHEVKVLSIDYEEKMISNEVILSPKGYYEAIGEDSTNNVLFSYMDGNIHSNYSYHEVFFDKNEAVKFYQNFLNEQKKIIENELELTIKIQNSFKP